ncbi:transposase zinc-binding domain-containing protein [Cystobacter fuscus]
MLAHGFARVRCESCKNELLVAFSCKGRGVCPSCNAKRAHVTAMHLVEQVLPHVPYRQWTLSFPHRVRWVLLKDVGLLSDVLTVFLRAVFALQRRRARRQGLRGGQAGACCPRRGEGGTADDSSRPSSSRRPRREPTPCTWERTPRRRPSSRGWGSRGSRRRTTTTSSSSTASRGRCPPREPALEPAGTRAT